MIKEDLIHYYWNSGKLKQHDLKTTNGNTLRILKPGTYNTNQGPDFLFAQIEIDGVIWNGHIEMHVQSSDWIKHKHDGDPNYANIILHVVWNHDKCIISNQHELPTIELKNLVSQAELSTYEFLMNNIQYIACCNLLSDVPNLIIQSQIESASIERIMSKTELLIMALHSNKSDWETLFYQKFCQYLVTPVNSSAMSELTTKVTWRLLQKYLDDPFKMEALLFGVSGLLPDHPNDPHLKKLKEEATYLIKLHRIKPMQKNSWNFLRLRPAHFPTIRLAQIASFFFKNPSPFNNLLLQINLNDIHAMLKVHASQYWDAHYTFENLSGKISKKKLGTTTSDSILINVICPMMYIYGDYTQDLELKNKAIGFLENIKAEENKFTRHWMQTGQKIENARQSQGVLQQINEYCLKNGCLKCKIGHHLMNAKTNHEN